MVNFRDSYFQVDLDLTAKRLKGTFRGKQYDTGRGFAVNVINGGQVVTPSTEVLRLKWEKPDNTTGYVNATIVNGKFIVENIDQMFTVHGSVRADFELSVAGEFVASITFYVNVEKAVAVDAIESSSDFSAFQQSVADFSTAVAGVTSDTEVILARGTEATLGARLDASDAQLADTAQRIDNLVTTPVPTGEIIAEEIIDARQGKASVGANITEVKSLLSENTSKLNTSTTVKRPLIVFISDDAKDGDVTTVAPAFASRGVPCNFAVITSKTDTDASYLNTVEIQGLAAAGHGIMSHSHSHTDLKTLSESQLRDDFAQSQIKLEAILGKKVSGIAYPYGESNETVVKVAREYFTHAYATGGEGYLLNDEYIDQYIIPRDVITYSTGANPRTLANITPLIDRCKSKGKLLVYCIHASEFIGAYADNLALLESVLDYIIAQGIAIVTYDEAINEKGNVLDIGTFKTQYVKVSKAGGINASNINKIVNNSLLFSDTATVTNATPVADYPVGRITRNYVSTSNAAGFPHGQQGYLYTYYLWEGTDLNYQKYVPTDSPYAYRRTWNRYSSVWNPWFAENQYAETTANRPKRARRGLMYFDTTLNKPIWCRTSVVIASDGSITTPPVWVDANGTIA